MFSGFIAWKKTANMATSILDCNNNNNWQQSQHHTFASFSTKTSLFFITKHLPAVFCRPCIFQMDGNVLNTLIIIWCPKNKKYQNVHSIEKRRTCEYKPKVILQLGYTCVFIEKWIDTDKKSLTTSEIYHFISQCSLKLLIYSIQL